VLDGNGLLYTLLRRLLPEDVVLRPNIDLDAIDTLPYVTFTGLGGQALNDGGGIPPIAWSWELDIQIVHHDLDSAKALAGVLYDGIHGWNDVWGDSHIVDGVGGATAVTDRSLFSVIGKADVPGHQLVQLAGAFSLDLHQA
jgi:hypothetical protein